MYFLFLLFGIMAVAVAFEKSKRLGSMLLAIVVLSLLLTASKKGEL
jgi:hypothetical protein